MPKSQTEARIAQATGTQGAIARFADGLRLNSGALLPDIEIAYRCYGKLNKDKSNAILVCHTFTSDHHPATDDKIASDPAQKPGWWQHVVGASRPIDTDRYFVICQNVLGGCAGSTGPKSINPDTGTPYGPNFPVITIDDMVRAQNMLLDYLDIPDLFCVIGGSMGGMQVLQWASAYGARVFSAIPIATSARHSAQNIALHEVCRQVIQTDPDWRDGAYYDQNCAPRTGLAIARMAAHITYLSEAALQRKFGRNLQDRARVSYGFEADFQVESYLRHQGARFAEHFDANSYLYITRAMDYFDLAAAHGGQLARAFTKSDTRFCVMSFSSDWLFPTSESVQLVRALNAAGARVSFVEIESDKGHDAFLLDEPEMFATLDGFLRAAGEARGLDAI